jgi:hypothetical protein
VELSEMERATMNFAEILIMKLFLSRTRWFVGTCEIWGVKLVDGVVQW